MPKEDEPKIFPVMCKNCSNSFDVKVPDYFVKVVKEKCECGMDESARVSRNIAFAASALFLCLFGSCAVSNHYNYKAIEAVSEKYDIYKVPPGDRLTTLEPEYKPVLKEPKPEPQKVEEKK